MIRRTRQLGEGQAGCIFSLLLLLAVAFIAYKMIPVKVKAAEFRQELVDEAKSGSLRTNKQIRANLMDKAEDLGLPLEENNLRISRSRSHITIEATYTVPVEFPGFTHMWEFSPSYSTPLF
ncbi:MAG: hypothetical protein R3338_00015 [Thermoanaerobaculia bacterium]|nr:hypothetical protein [Thermoanaerobaculia bacterium]